MSGLSVELEYTFLFPSRNGRSLWAVIITLGTRDSCRKGKSPMSTAVENRRVAWHYLKLAEATSNPKTGASLLHLADYWAKLADECAARAQSISDPERRADMLRVAGIWLSLTEPAKDELRGAYEWPRQRAA